MNCHKLLYGLFLTIIICLHHANIVASNNVQTRIFGGVPASLGRIPYQAFLFLTARPGDRSGFACGGTLISNQFVLTAAHCVCLPESETLGGELIVSLGMVNRQNQEGVQLKVGRNGLIKHPGYTSSRIVNDIALVRLPEPVEFNAHIQPVSLPNRYLQDLTGQQLLSSGFGRTSDSSTKTSNILLYIKTNVLSEKQCASFRYTSYEPRSQICINAPGRSTCRGDSGGPHVLELKGRKMVVGVTSYGDAKGCTAGSPQVLTRVTYYLDWIQQNTGIRV